MSNSNDHDPNPQGDPNRGDSSRQRQGHAQWNQLPAQTPLSYLPSFYPPPPRFELGYYQYPPTSQYPQPNFGRQQQPPLQYSPSQYANSGYMPPSNMAAIHTHQGNVPYRLRPLPGSYCSDPLTQAQAPEGTYQGAAPRRRTAVACRYCRCRKIRCSGSETSADGRCRNCLKSDQDCLFIPVSSPTQAYVPAHAVYPHLRTGLNEYATSGPEGPEGCRGPPIPCGTHRQPLAPQQQKPQNPEIILPPPQGPQGM